MVEKHDGRLFSNVNWGWSVELYVWYVTAAEFGVKIENAGTHTNGFRQTQIARIQERVAAKPNITFARLRADLNMDTADLRQLAREAGVELR